ncbi:MAG TPA: cupin domain-containing protein [Chitinophagaceae bacterium]|nr:cupin domain-containing protein [Chitinophagaceae bacterium]
MQNLNNIPYKELAPGILSKLVHGKKSTLSVVDIKQGSILPEHKHKHEQITFIVEGELEMMIKGKKYLLTAGSVHVIPSNFPHSAKAITDCRVIDVFSPVREDYK